MSNTQRRDSIYDDVLSIRYDRYRTIHTRDRDRGREKSRGSTRLLVQDEASRSRFVRVLNLKESPVLFPECSAGGKKIAERRGELSKNRGRPRRGSGSCSAFQYHRQFHGRADEDSPSRARISQSPDTVTYRRSISQKESAKRCHRVGYLNDYIEKLRYREQLARYPRGSTDTFESATLSPSLFNTSGGTLYLLICTLKGKNGVCV